MTLFPHKTYILAYKVTRALILRPFRLIHAKSIKIPTFKNFYVLGHKTYAKTTEFDWDGFCPIFKSWPINLNKSYHKGQDIVLWGNRVIGQIITF